jgi:serine protease Do
VFRFGSATLAALALGLFLSGACVAAEEFNYDRLQQNARSFTVELRVQIQFSYGMQTNEHEERMLGTIVSEDGLVIFDGGFLGEENPLSPMSSFAFKTTPTRIEATTLDGVKYEAEYLGMDQSTGIGFARIEGAGGKVFQPVKFKTGKKFRTGQWLAIQTLLPEFVTPSLAIDVGMISAHITAPEDFPLAVGFSSFELASVLFDAGLDAVGVLGVLSNPNASANDMADPYGGMEFPLMGVVRAERLMKLIANPPIKGRADRAWLGITLQALTPDIAAFLRAEATGGIIVNEVVPASPAQAAGLQVGDIIYEIDGQPVDVDREEKIAVFQRRISQMPPGVTTVFSVLRPTENGVTAITVPAVLEAAPMAAADAPEYESVLLEFKVRDLVFSDYQIFNVPQGSIAGAVVTELGEGGPANMSGLRIGDIIQRVNGAEIQSVDDLAEVMMSLSESGAAEVVLFVWRFGQTMFVNIKTS